MELITEKTDTLLNVNYELYRVSAKTLAISLKEFLKFDGINYNQFNSAIDKADPFHESDEDAGVNIPNEIYEYQNFFVLRERSGKMYLLDGFRRLLWYNAPDTQVYVRVYNREALTDTQILTLMVYLNHFKFFSASNNYLDRGFSLLLKSVFDIDTSQIFNTVNAYLDNDYSTERFRYNRPKGSEQNQNVKARIVNPLFISDMKFLQALGASGYLASSKVGSLLQSFRAKHSVEYSITTFLEKVKANPAMPDLMDKKEYSERHSDKETAISKILEIYTNIFEFMSGGTLKKSYAEKMKECKELVAAFTKDKNYTKMSGNRQYYILNPLLQKLADAGRELEFKCVVYPSQNKEQEEREYGLISKVKFENKFSTEKWDDGAQIKITIGGKVFTAARESLGERRYFRAILKGFDRRFDNYRIELFVNISKKEFQQAVKDR